MSGKVGKTVHKIVRIADCCGIILPKEYITEQGLNCGDRVELLYNDTMEVKPLREEDILQELEEIKIERASGLSESR